MLQLRSAASRPSGGWCYSMARELCCGICGDSFRAKSVRSLALCYGAHRLTCSGCGIEQEIIRSAGERERVALAKYLISRRWFCSKSCANRERFSAKWCEGCGDETLFYLSNGKCVGCNKRSFSTEEFCESCGKMTSRSTAGGSCLNCSHSTHSRYCETCKEFRAFLGDSCKKCSAPKSIKKWCNSCEAFTSQNGRLCYSCQARDLFALALCEDCGEERIHRAGHCMACQAIGLTIVGYCGPCGRETTHTRARGICLSCTLRANYELRYCQRCDLETKHTVAKGRCQSCKFAAIRSLRWCEDCRSDSVHFGSKCHSCSTRKHNLRLFKAGRRNRSMIEVSIMGALGFSPDYIDGISVDGRRGNLLLEYDGSYYHRNRIAQDTASSLRLLGLGYDLVRIRESELALLNIDHPRYFELNIPYDKRSPESAIWSARSFLIESKLIGNDNENSPPSRGSE